MENNYLQYGAFTMGFPFFDLSWLFNNQRENSLHPLAQTKSVNYKPQYFEDKFYMDVDDVKQLTTFEANYLPIGEVIMVRSANVTEMGDHFAVISGPIENKEHGVRPQTISIAMSPNGINMLDLFEPKNGVIILKLSSKMRDAFHNFHDARVVGKEIHCLISKTA